MMQIIVNSLAILAVLMLGGGILLIGMAAMAAVYCCIWGDADERFVIGVDFGKRHLDAEEKMVDICEEVIDPYKKLMSVTISQFEEAEDLSNLTM